jgi:hypothetical protein
MYRLIFLEKIKPSPVTALFEKCKNDTLLNAICNYLINSHLVYKFIIYSSSFIISVGIDKLPFF